MFLHSQLSFSTKDKQQKVILTPLFSCLGSAGRAVLLLTDCISHCALSKWLEVQLYRKAHGDFVVTAFYPMSHLSPSWNLLLLFLVLFFTKWQEEIAPYHSPGLFYEASYDVFLLSVQLPVEEISTFRTCF